jgi:membrane protein required for beta-lactamase induction
VSDDILPEHDESWSAPRWVILALKLAIAVVGSGGIFLGGEFRGVETTRVAAFGEARERVADEVESLEASRNARPPEGVVVHLASVVADLEQRLKAAERRECPADGGTQ